MKSPDAFRTISEVADWLDRPTHVLRFWESKFPQIKPVKRAGGRRYYRPQDMLLLGGIKRLLHDDGMTIKGVQKILREQGIAQVVALSHPLDDEMAARAVLDQARVAVSIDEAPMAVMTGEIYQDVDEYLFHDTVETADGGRVLQFADLSGRGSGSAPPAPVRFAPDPSEVTPPPADRPAPAQVDAKPATVRDQPSLPFDLPQAGADAAPLAADPAPVPATLVTVAAPKGGGPPPLAVGVLAKVARQAAPLSAASRAALLPLVQRLVPLARRMRAGFAGQE
jgi:DNA-binding transcriptional MerR regulator